MRFVSDSRWINVLIFPDESRCQVYISSAAPLDDLFFPDAIASTRTADGGGDSNESIMAAEALSETLHAAAHPNVSVYNPGERQAREKRESQDAGKASAFGVLGIWTGEDERFAYVRSAVFESHVLANDRDRNAQSRDCRK